MFLGANMHVAAGYSSTHIGALRNNWRQLKWLVMSLDHQRPSDGRRVAQAAQASRTKKNLLPKTILYRLNPRDNEVLGTMIGNFQGEGMPAKCSSVPAGGLRLEVLWNVR